MKDVDIEKLFRKCHERPGDVFVETLKRDDLIIAPGVYDAMGAGIAKDVWEARKKANRPCSYNAVYAGGWSISAMTRRKPDMGFLKLPEVVAAGRWIMKEAYPLPVIFDAETGFGSAVTLEETVELYHQIGVALAHMEDQDAEMTRRCGNIKGKWCISKEMMVAKIRSWLMVSKSLGTSMHLMARTDALTASGGGLKDAIARGIAYMDVDYQGLRPLVLWADAMIAPDDLKRWVEAMRKHDPKMILGINYSPNKDWVGYYMKKHNRMPPTFKELYDGGDGFQVIWHTILQARIAMEAVWNGFDEMAEKGQEVLWNLHERQRNHPVGDAQGMSNAPAYQSFERFIGGEDAEKRYKDSQGYGDSVTEGPEIEKTLEKEKESPEKEGSEDGEVS